MNPGSVPPSPGVLQQGTYFFLSYAHFAPIPGRPPVRDDTDSFVGKLFYDLVRAVEAHDGTGLEMRPGFFDQMLSPSQAIKSQLPAILGSTQVFVPLLSPKYFETSWSLRELEMFRGRLHTAADASERHILPILWTPFLSWKRPALVDQLLKAGQGMPDYHERGLRGLQSQSRYRQSYQQVVDRVASQIVSLAVNDPLPASRAPAMDEVQPIHVENPSFTVTYLLSHLAELDADSPGQGPDWWWPDDFTGLPSAAERAGDIAERLGLSVDVAAFGEVGDRLTRTPGVVLVDPRIVSDLGTDSLAALLAGCPPWTVVVVLHPGNGGDSVTQKAVEALTAIPQLLVRDARSMEALAQALPPLISRARQSFLHSTSVQTLEGTTERPPRLSDSRRWRSKENGSDE